MKHNLTRRSFLQSIGAATLAGLLEDGARGDDFVDQYVDLLLFGVRQSGSRPLPSRREM